MPLIIEPKENGYRIQAHRQGNDIKILTDGGKERHEILVDLTAELKSLPADNFILDGELILLKNGQPIPRAEMARVGVGKEPIKGEELRYYVFDVPFYEEDISQKPLSERIKILNKILPKDLEYIKRMPSWEASNKKEYDAAVKKAIAFSGSEGFMGKELESLYTVGRGPGWIKMKITKEIKIKTIGILKKPNPWDKKPDKDLTGQEALDAFKKLQEKSETYILRGAILGKDGKDLMPIESDHKLSQGDLELRWDAKREVWSGTEDPQIWQIGAGFKSRGKGEYALGKTYAKRLNPAPKISDVVTIRPTTMRFFNNPDGTQGISWENPRLEEIDTERKDPDSYADAERIIAASAKMIGKPEKATTALAKIDRDQWLDWQLKVAPNKYPQHYAIMSNHYRGRSSHLDFRVKFNSYLRGWTIDDQPEGVIKEGIDTIEQGRKTTDQTDWKFGPDMDPNRKVLVERKAIQPLIWINFARENVIEPGSMGACLTEIDVLTARGWENIKAIGLGRRVFSKITSKSGLIEMRLGKVQETFEIEDDPKEKFELKIGDFKTVATYDHLWYCAHVHGDNLVSNIDSIGWELTKDIFLEAFPEEVIEKCEDRIWYKHPYMHMAIPKQGLMLKTIREFKRWGWKQSQNKYWLLHPILIQKVEGLITTYNLSIKGNENYLTSMGISHNTKYEEGVFNTRAVGFAYPGARKPWYEEYWLDMKGPKETYYHKRLVFRQIATPEEPKKMRTAIKTSTFWAAFLTKTDTPYILSARGRKKRDWVPDGEEIISGLPPWWEEKIPQEMHWWGKNLSQDEMLDLMDKAYEYLKVKAKSNKEKLLVAKQTVQFALKRHWWQGQCIHGELEIAAPEGLIEARKLKDKDFILASDLNPLEVIKAQRIMFPRYLKITYGLSNIYDPQKDIWKSGKWVVSMPENTPIWIRAKDNLYEGWLRADALKKGDHFKIPVFICPYCGFRAPSFILYKHLPICKPGMTKETYSQELIRTALEIGQTFFVYAPIKAVVWKQTFRSFISLEVKSRWTSVRSFLSAIGPVHNTVVRDLPIEHWDLIIEANSNNYLEEYQFEFNPLEKQEPLSARLNELKEPPFDKEKISDWFKWEGRISPGKFGNPNKRIDAFIETIDSGLVQIQKDEDILKSFVFKGKDLKGHYIMKREDPKAAFWSFQKIQIQKP